MLRDKIMAANDRQRQPVHVPEWDCTVHIAVMSGDDRDQYEQLVVSRMKDGKLTDARGIRAQLLVRTLVTDDGARIFSDGDAELLGTKSAAVIARLAELAQKLNGLTDRDVEDLAKN
jgi:hypothetical protein